MGLVDDAVPESILMRTAIEMALAGKRTAKKEKAVIYQQNA